MRRKFERFLDKHGAKIGYDKAVGVQAERGGFGIVRSFMDYCFNGDGREHLFSGVGRTGFADDADGAAAV
jgi:hypothetical protein